MTGEPRAQAVQEQALRDNCSRMLTMCTEKQQAFFHRVHDGAPWKGWVNCPTTHGGRQPLAAAHDLLCRSIDEAGRAALSSSGEEGK